MSDDWPQIKARLGSLAKYTEDVSDWGPSAAADIRAALQRESEQQDTIDAQRVRLKELQDESQALRQRVEACEAAFKRQGELLALEKENHRITAASADKLDAALRQRIKELERMCCQCEGDCCNQQAIQRKRAEAAEARVEELELLVRSKYGEEKYKQLKRAEAAERELADMKKHLNYYMGRTAQAEAQLRLSTIDAANEMARANDAEAEVKRLEGLILDWADTREDVFGPRHSLLAEAKRIRGEK